MARAGAAERRLAVLPSPGPKIAGLISLTLLAAGCGGGAEQARPAPETAASGAPAAKTPCDEANQPRPAGERGETGSRVGGAGFADLDGGDSTVSINQPGPPGTRAQSISSNGAGLLCFEVDQPSRLAWRNSPGKPFSVKGRGISIDSTRGRGAVDIAPGRYENFYVSGASWTIVVRPR